MITIEKQKKKQKKNKTVRDNSNKCYSNDY